MEDSDFDKIFGDKMRQAGAPDHSDEDWERLTPRLDAQQQERRVLPLWWLGLLGGLLLCSNIAWWQMWRQSEKNTEALRSEWQQMARTGVTLRDTSWKKVIVYQYDTVYRTLIYRSSPGDRQLLSRQENTNGDRIATSGISENRPDGNAQPGQASAATGQGTNTTGSIAQIAASERRSDNFAPLPPVSTLLQIPERDVVLPLTDLVFIPADPAQGTLLLRPRQFRIGIGGGLLQPIAPGFYQKNGFSTSITAEIAFSDQLALTLEGAYGGISFKGNTYDERLGLELPASPGDDYALKYFEVHEGFKPLLQMSIGMRYWLRSAHKLSPYLGLGYAAQWQPGYELEVEYLNPLTGAEKSRSSETSFQGTPVSYLDVNAGLRYRFSKHWFWQTGAAYQRKIDAGQPGIPGFWGLKSGVLFGF